jgi:hypothetical protein
LDQFNYIIIITEIGLLRSFISERKDAANCFRHLLVAERGGTKEGVHEMSSKQQLYAWGPGQSNLHNNRDLILQLLYIIHPFSIICKGRVRREEGSLKPLAHLSPSAKKWVNPPYAMESLTMQLARNP